MTTDERQRMEYEAASRIMARWMCDPKFAETVQAGLPFDGKMLSDIANGALSAARALTIIQAKMSTPEPASPSDEIRRGDVVTVLDGTAVYRVTDIQDELASLVLNTPTASGLAGRVPVADLKRVPPTESVG